MKLCQTSEEDSSIFTFLLYIDKTPAVLFQSLGLWTLANIKLPSESFFAVKSKIMLSQTTWCILNSYLILKNKTCLWWNIIHHQLYKKCQSKTSNKKQMHHVVCESIKVLNYNAVKCYFTKLMAKSTGNWHFQSAVFIWYCRLSIFHHCTNAFQRGGHWNIWSRDLAVSWSIF